MPVAEHLNNVDYNILTQVYANHNSSMSMVERVNYTLSHIAEVNKIKDGVLLVRYEDDRCWYYTIKGKFEEITL